MYTIKTAQSCNNQYIQRNHGTVAVTHVYKQNMTQLQKPMYTIKTGHSCNSQCMQTNHDTVAVTTV